MPAEPPTESALGPKVHLSPPPRRQRAGNGRFILGSVLLVAAAVCIIVGLGMLRDSPAVAFTGYGQEADGSPSSGGSIKTELRCVPVVGGTEGQVDAGEDTGDDVVLEYQNSSAAVLSRGLESGEISGSCDRARLARVGHAMEVGFLALVLLGTWGLLFVRRPREPRSEAEPGAGRRADGAVL